jgi:hemoglobin
MMKPRRLLLIAALAAVKAAAQTQAPADDSLYRAWGGTAGIRAVVEDFVLRLEADARIGHRFKPDGRRHLTTMLTQQLCREAGGPCKYEGEPMGPSHAGMDITRADFNALVEVLQQSMQAKGIPFAAQNRMLARLAPMHREIITR